MVPAGASFGAWHKRRRARGQTGGGGGPLLGDNMLLRAWLDVAGVARLTPTTLVPLGVLVLLYNLFASGAGLPRQLRGGGDGGAHHPLVRQALASPLRGGALPSLLVPFGLLMGVDVYRAATGGASPAKMART